MDLSCFFLGRRPLADFADLSLLPMAEMLRSSSSPLALRSEKMRS